MLFTDRLIQSQLVLAFALGSVAVVLLLCYTPPKARRRRRVDDDVFLNMLSYDRYKPAEMVRRKVERTVGGWVEPACAHAALERLVGNGRAQRRMIKRFVETRTRKVPMYKRTADFRPKDLGIPLLELPDVPRQWAVRA